MAHIESGSGGRKTNLELNLVPVIDLMSVLITFLLITAVWTQVSLIQIANSVAGKRTNDKTPTPPPRAEVVLKLDIRANGYTLNLAGQAIRLPLVGGQFDEAGLFAQLEKFKERYPEKIDGNLAMSDDLPYDRLIRGMDAFLKAGFIDVAVLTGNP